MAKNKLNMVRLGLFVLAGLLFLILLLYMIGKNRNLFGHVFLLKARFENVQGLVPGNNVRFAGIAIGTVKRIQIVNDTLIEVVMVIDNKMKPFIHNNAVAAIGTDGLMGNKVINVTPSRVPAELVKEGDVLISRRAPDTDDMLQTLSKTNQDVASVAANLKTAVQRINNSTALWKILNDETLPQNLKRAGINIQQATARAATTANDLQQIVQHVKEGKGSVGALLTDTSFASNLNTAIHSMKNAGDRANDMALALDNMVTAIQQDVQNGKGTVNALLKDSAIVMKLNASLENIRKGTDGFNQNMEALKHNFLFRGYFKKQEKQKQKESRNNIAVQQNN